ncbi:hypothetical protein LHL20_19410 [Alteromonas sp. McT4-15]|uniref:hypothetical protein n=1 Tax=Alteromonas sp. McT4-15 TaxID=2881256 RepID=UPI001CF91F5D|nr:hypothetical protein [Alteromonas sp. McT4-15]MCB4438403.1 hypothetical protein [Alteromonas sp. McT4-15]
MIKTTTLRFISVCISLIAGFAMASDINTLEGVWKHDSKPAYIEFNLDSGIASVKEHLTHKENTGLTVIKNIVKSESSNAKWVGDMFDGYNDQYVPVTIILGDRTVSIFDSDNNEVLTLLKE